MQQDHFSRMRAKTARRDYEDGANLGDKCPHCLSGRIVEGSYCINCGAAESQRDVSDIAISA